MSQSTVMQITSLRLLIRENIYLNNKDLLLNYIAQNFDCASITFDNINMRIDIKIKKTSMKKVGEYTHNVNYYYPLICQSFTSFFNDVKIQNEFMSSINNVDCTQDSAMLYNSVLSNILSLFNATAVLDNIIYIYL